MLTIISWMLCKCIILIYYSRSFVFFQERTFGWSLCLLFETECVSTVNHRMSLFHRFLAYVPERQIATFTSAPLPAKWNIMLQSKQPQPPMRICRQKSAASEALRSALDKEGKLYDRKENENTSSLCQTILQKMAARRKRNVVKIRNRKVRWKETQSWTTTARSQMITPFRAFANLAYPHTTTSSSCGDVGPQTAADVAQAKSCDDVVRVSCMPRSSSLTEKIQYVAGGKDKT